MRHRWSRRAYRVLLRIYPHEFRDRFRDDLERDFADLLAARGRGAAWRAVLPDLARSLPGTYAHVGPSRRRRRLFYPPGESAMSSLVFDMRHAVRALIQAPVFTAITVATLALGIGANSAIFSLVNAVLLRPLGYHEPDRLMLLYEVIPESRVPRFGVSPPDYIDLRGDAAIVRSALGLPDSIDRTVGTRRAGADYGGASDTVALRTARRWRRARPRPDKR